MDSANYENMMGNPLAGFGDCGADHTLLPGERLGDVRPEKAAAGGFGAILFLAGARHIYMNSNGDWQDYAAAMAMLLAGGLMTNSIY